MGLLAEWILCGLMMEDGGDAKVCGLFDGFT